MKKEDKNKSIIGKIKKSKKTEDTQKNIHKENFGYNKPLVIVNTSKPRIKKDDDE